MRTADAVKFFGNKSKVAVAARISRHAVSQWGDVVPIGSAINLEIASKGELPVRISLYKKKARK